MALPCHSLASDGTLIVMRSPVPVAAGVAGTAVCMRSETGDPVSLGAVAGPPTPMADGSVAIVYTSEYARLCVGLVCLRWPVQLLWIDICSRGGSHVRVPSSLLSFFENHNGDCDLDWGWSAGLQLPCLLTLDIAIYTSEWNE